MIEIFEVLGWLNIIDDCSRLTGEAKRLTSAARVTTRSDASVQRMIDRLQTIGDESGDGLQKAEIDLHTAALAYWRGWFPQAARYVKQALYVYKNERDKHRYAIAMWMLGMTQWRLFKNQPAYTNWDRARELFTDQRNSFRHSSREKEWYDCALRKMDVDLACKPEEAHEWINCFGEPSLSAESEQFVKAIQEKIRQRAYPDVYTLMTDLQAINKWTPVKYERAHAYLECGLATYQAGNLSQATELLRKAVQELSPGIGDNHKQMIARWMLGAVVWMTPGNEVEAISDWRKCIADIEQLKQKADKDNQRDRKKWCADRAAILKEALSEHLPDGPRRKCPAGLDNLEGLPPGDGDGYDYLVTLVGGDRAVADRLIEYEADYARNTGRADLIQRALDRLLRERR